MGNFMRSSTADTSPSARKQARPFHPIAPFTNPINSPYESTALNCGN
jgi:hypothetical protein